MVYSYNGILLPAITMNESKTTQFSNLFVYKSQNVRMIEKKSKLQKDTFYIIKV